ncbi:MAG: hypothetical protein KC656_36935, partial [Myxococcales bacterium]|nr:hypothetical protein [Myxococcales bacterium]
NVYPSQRYKEVAELTGGSVNNICEGNWSAMLTNLGLNATGVISSFQLSNAALPETLEVFVDEVLVDPADYVYEPETWYIHFADDAIPARESVIVANYKVASGQPRPPGVDAPVETAP